MLETAWESRWLPGPLKNLFGFERDQAGVAIRKWKMYLENCTQIVFLKRKATSDFYDKKELRLNINSPNSKSKDENMSF